VRLPKTLDREPLVDAVFEVRLGGDPHMSDLLPGILFGQLDPKPTIQRLPAAEIPQPIRVNDPNLAFAPVIRLDWREFTISFGERNLVIGCKLPYPKWPRFKETILDIVAKVARVGIAGPVERYSVKYVNLIQAPTLADQIAKINLAVRVGDVEAKDDHLSVQVHRSEGDTLHIMSVVTGAQGKMPDGKTVFGAVVDIDSIRTAHFSDFGAFAAKLEPAVESLRQSNKIKFFSCLTEATINEMGPKYD
jgi:uncharacterized protein (TIGR04255 family)